MSRIPYRALMRPRRLPHPVVGEHQRGKGTLSYSAIVR